MEPLVSIIVPAYNAERFIGETIDSIIGQSYTSWELLIINDGSTDKTKQIIESYILKDKRIQLLDQSNHGVSVARNTGFKNAKGEFIAMLDSDDIWLTNNLKEKVIFLQSHEAIDFVFSDRNVMDEKLQQIRSAPLSSDENIFEDTLLWIGEPVPGPCGNVVFRRSCLNKDIYFRPELSNIADKHFIVQLAKHFTGKRIPKILWTYRQVEGSMSKNIKLHETDTLKAYALYKEAGFFKSDPFRRKCFSNMYLIIAASWWNDGNNKLRGFYFVMLAFVTAPFNTIAKLFHKIFK